MILKAYMYLVACSFTYLSSLFVYVHRSLLKPSPRNGDLKKEVEEKGTKLTGEREAKKGKREASVPYVPLGVTPS